MANIYKTFVSLDSKRLSSFSFHLNLPLQFNCYITISTIVQISSRGSAFVGI